MQLNGGQRVIISTNLGRDPKQSTLSALRRFWKGRLASLAYISIKAHLVRVYKDRASQVEDQLAQFFMFPQPVGECPGKDSVCKNTEPATWLIGSPERGPIYLSRFEPAR